MTTTDPAASTYAETWAGRGVPMDELAAFVARAVDAGAPLTARIRLEDVDRNVLLGLTAPGTRMSITWAFAPRPAAPIPRAGAYDEVEQVVALEDARYRQERATNRPWRVPGGPMDPKRLALIHDVPVDMVDVKTHADQPADMPAVDVQLESADPWPFNPGDVVDDIGGAITEWLDAAPEGTIVRTSSGDEWTNDGTKPGDALPTWIHRRDRTSPGFAARSASPGLVDDGPLTVITVGPRQ